MTATIEIREKTVNNRDVISFSKTYREQEHEVFAPKEHATQILLSLLAILNEDRSREDQFVLLRKSQVGSTEPVEPVEDELLKRQVLADVADALFGEDLAETLLFQLDESTQRERVPGLDRPSQIPVEEEPPTPGA